MTSSREYIGRPSSTSPRWSLNRIWLFSAVTRQAVSFVDSKNSRRPLVNPAQQCIHLALLRYRWHLRCTPLEPVQTAAKPSLHHPSRASRKSPIPSKRGDNPDQESARAGAIFPHRRARTVEGRPTRANCATSKAIKRD